MEADGRRAIRPTNPDDVRLVQRPDSEDPCDGYGVIEWHAAWGNGWPLTGWLPAIEEPGLFYKIARGIRGDSMADLHRGGEGVAADALEAFRRFGPLLYDHESFWESPRRGKGFILEERVYDWGYNAARMRHARDLYRALDDARYGAFEKIAGIVGQHATPDELIREGEQKLVEWINSSLRDTVYIELQPLADAGRVIREDRAAVRLAYAPRNLLGSAWLMFAREVVGETVIAECDNCHTFFSRDADRARANMRFCSDKCRNRAWVRDNRKGKHAEESKGE